MLQQRVQLDDRFCSDPATGSPIVLVVDDRVDQLEAVRTTLELAGYRVLLASQGERAIAMFVAEAPDCVLLDVRMPDLDGFAVCARIRALPRGVDTPIIFLTALRDVDTFDQALRAGGDDFLTKPLQSAELLVRICSALKLRRMRGELREHYDLLKHQRDALQRLQLQKERLMAFVVHDLKNPVNAMDLHAQVLLRAKDLPPALRESATHIRTEARQLTRMVLNLLDFSKADEGRLSPKMSRVDVRLLASEVVDELAMTAQSRKVALECAADIDPIRADEDLLRRALTNLVENALRHAPPETVVTLTAATHASWTDFRIADAGAGVPPEMRERIFDPYVQMDGGSDRPPGGTRALASARSGHVDWTSWASGGGGETANDGESALGLDADPTPSDVGDVGICVLGGVPIRMAPDVVSGCPDGRLVEGSAVDAEDSSFVVVEPNGDVMIHRRCHWILFSQGRTSCANRSSSSSYPRDVSMMRAVSGQPPRERSRGQGRVRERIASGETDAALSRTHCTKPQAMHRRAGHLDRKAPLAPGA